MGKIPDVQLAAIKLLVKERKWGLRKAAAHFGISHGRLRYWINPKHRADCIASAARISAKRRHKEH